MSNNEDKGTGFFIGFIAGVAVGLAIGFLYAPRPGEETRELLKKKAEETLEKMKVTAAEVKKKARQQLKQAEE